MLELTKGCISGEQIKSIITKIIENPQDCGFRVFAVTKSEPRLKEIRFYNGDSGSLREKLKDSMMGILQNKYNTSDAEYVSADRVADEQNKIYIINPTDLYTPFEFLNSIPGTFSKKDISDVTGIFFSFRNKVSQIWAYQHLWPIMVPNKSRRNIMARLVSQKEGDEFIEENNPIIAISERIDLLVINGSVITSNYKLLQNEFGFHDYIRARAENTIFAIQNIGFVKNTDKLRKYIQRGNGKTKYAKKMMRVAESRVLKMNSHELWNKINKSDRWRGRIKEENGKFVLNNYDDVEILIDLLDERYTRSEITDTEYDTDVKHIAE